LINLRRSKKEESNFKSKEETSQSVRLFFYFFRKGTTKLKKTKSKESTITYMRLAKFSKRESIRKSQRKALKRLEISIPNKINFHC
jgi:hypothetical protein